MPSAQKKPLIEKLAFRHLEKLSKDNSKNLSDEFYFLNPKERKNIQQQRRRTIAWAALTGALAVVLLYAPQWAFPDLFFTYPIVIPVIDQPFDVPVVTTIYGLILVLVEVVILTLLNLKATAGIAEICNFPRSKEPDYKLHVEALVKVGLEKPDKQVRTIGINPFQGMPKITLLLYMLLTKIKAGLSNFLFKLIVKRLLGRFALRVVMDLAGIPIYAFWNAYASHTVTREAKIRILAPDLVKLFVRDLKKQFPDSPQFRKFLYDSLQYIAMAKRDYHYNHYFLASKVIEQFQIETVEEHQLSPDFFEQLQASSPEIKTGISRLLVFGFMIDGHLSRRERKAIDQLLEKNIILTDFSTIRRWAKDFLSGKGLEALQQIETLTAPEPTA